MFAVIRTGGKQYRVAKDDTIVVEKLLGDPGAMVELTDVLMIGGDGKKAPVMGSSALDKAAVFAEVVEQSRAAKIVVFKKNRRKNYRRTRGHRQEQTVLRILDVSATGTKPKAAAKTAAKLKPAADEKPEAKKETAAEKPAKTKSKAPEKKEVKKEKKKAPAKKTDTKKTAAKKPETPKKKTAPKKKAAPKKKTKE